MDALTQGFQLEGLQVAPLTGKISGPGGIARLDPKVMDVLVLMASHARQVVLREELVTRLWGHAVVTDDAVTRCFYELRRHLVQAGGHERYRDLVETVPKRGYRLNATVVPGLPPPEAPVSPVVAVAPEPPAATAPKRPWMPAAAVALVAIVAGLLLWKSPEKADLPAKAGPVTHSIAVLPFLDMSEAKDQHYLADGMTEEILNHLAQAENLRVIARTSTFALRDTKLDVTEIGKRLGVEYVLEGSVRRSGDRLRITAQLIDAASNSHAWSRTYDRTLDDLFAVQDDIAGSVASALQVELTGSAARAATQPGFEAYEQYLLGQANYYRRGPGDTERAIAYYRRAVEIDPQFARAWAALAGAYSLLNDASPGDETHRERQGEAARRAVELDPGLAVAQARLAQYLGRSGQSELAGEHFEKALALDPNDPLVLGFSTSRAMARGDLEAATGIWRRLVERDPLSQLNRHNLGIFLLATGRPQEAVAQFRSALEISPTSEDNRIDLARALIFTGETTEAATLLRQLPPGPQRDLVFALLVRDPQHGPAARAMLASLKVPPIDVRSCVRLAEAHASSGDREAAFRILEAARAEGERRKAESPTLIWYLREELQLTPFLEPLHDDPRWAGLTARPSNST